MLTVLLYAFSIPIIGLMLAFIGLVVGLSVGRQRNEIAVLRSRGATALQIVGIAGRGHAAGGCGAWRLACRQHLVAQTIGATRSFLNFTLDPDLRVQMTSTALRFGLIAVVVTMLAQVLPSIGAARHTIVSYKQELARTVRKPWWQRAWLDVLLLIPAGLRHLSAAPAGQRLVMPGAPDAADMFDNPLLFLLPALGALALTLLILRLLPLMMACMAWLAAHEQRRLPAGDALPGARSRPSIPRRWYC